MHNRTKVYKTLEGLRRQLHSGYLTAEEMRNKRAYFKDGWHSNFRIAEEEEEKFWQGIAHVVWRKPTQRNINSLRPLNIGLMSRLMYHGNEYRQYSYCTGQDYPGEIRCIQYHANKN